MGNGGTNAITFDYRAPNAAAGTWSERMRINSAGNVGIGVVPKSWTMDALQLGLNAALAEDSNSVYLTANAYINAGWKRTNAQSAGYVRMGTNDGVFSFSNTATGAADSDIVWSERMRIDNAGHLLVGKTAPDAAVAGSELKADGTAVFSRSSTSPTMYVSTLGSDGDLISFRKDSTTVGSWQSRAGLVSTIILDPRPSGVGLSGGGPFIYPTNNAGAISDGAIGIGHSTSRFSDLYLSGGVYLGGTAAANKLDDYEEGNWTPTSDSGAWTVSGATYTKIGRQVTIMVEAISFADITTIVSLKIGGLPFAQSITGSGVAMWARVSVPCGTVYISGQKIYFYNDSSSGNFSPLTHANLLSGNGAYFAATYFTNE